MYYQDKDTKKQRKITYPRSLFFEEGLDFFDQSDKDKIMLRYSSNINYNIMNSSNTINMRLLVED